MDGSFIVLVCDQMFMVGGIVYIYSDGIVVLRIVNGDVSCYYLYVGCWVFN